MGIELLIILTTMSNKKKRFILPEEEIPQYWYNIQADMVNKPMPPLHPGTKQPLKAEDLYPIFAEELCRQELNQTDTWIEIPEEVREMYKYYRSTPLVRAYGLEKALGTPAHIYFKNESVSPMGSHKLNSAIPVIFRHLGIAMNNVSVNISFSERERSALVTPCFRFQNTIRNRFSQWSNRPGLKVIIDHII